jgi:hypothetical protein
LFTCTCTERLGNDTLTLYVTSDALKVMALPVAGCLKSLLISDLFAFETNQNKNYRLVLPSLNFTIKLNQRDNCSGYHCIVYRLIDPPPPHVPVFSSPILSILEENGINTLNLVKSCQVYSCADS